MSGGSMIVRPALVSDAIQGLFDRFCRVRNLKGRILAMSIALPTASGLLHPAHEFCGKNSLVRQKNGALCELVHSFVKNMSNKNYLTLFTERECRSIPIERANLKHFGRD